MPNRWERKGRGGRVLVCCLALLVLAGCSSQVESQAPVLSQESTGSSSMTTSRSLEPTASKQGVIEPDAVAFWNAQQGLLVSTVTTPSCLEGQTPCLGGLIERTLDGGVTWQVVDRTSRALDAVAVSKSGVAWVSTKRCATSEASSCGTARFLETSDSGETWRSVDSATPVSSVSLVSPTTAWAVGAGPEKTWSGTDLMKSTDGGHSWQSEGDPCQDAGGVTSVDFSGPSQGWAMCTGEPATQMQGKAVLQTDDAGKTWVLKSECQFPGGMGSQSVLGNVSCGGFSPGIQFLSSGFGWMWMDGGGISSSDDGGKLWEPIGQGVVIPGGNTPISASLVSDSRGYVLIDKPTPTQECPASGCGPELLVTDDAGKTWRDLRNWSEPVYPDCCQQNKKVVSPFRM